MTVLLSLMMSLVNSKLLENTTDSIHSWELWKFHLEILVEWIASRVNQSNEGEKPFESLSIFTSVFSNFTAFTQCAKSRTVSVVWACRKENQAMKDCMTH